MSWPKNLAIRADYLLREKTTFKIGGPARFFCEPRNVEELTALVKLARQNKIPVFILGSGSNILISDNGVKGLVIKLSSPYFKRLIQEGNAIRAGSGIGLNQLIKFAQDKSLSGLEFLIGIPGSLGGALAMNAGCWEFCIGDLIKEVEVMDKIGRIKVLKREEIKFEYRRSSLANYIILGSLLGLKQGNRTKIKKNIKMYLEKRFKLQGLTGPNAGCIFKNPKNHYAGKLIDRCGLKGRNIGGAFISSRHANFIVNKGKAGANDVLRLIRLVKKQVKDRFNVDLQPEIKIWR